MTGRLGYLTGKILLFEGFLLFFCALFDLFSDNSESISFIISGVITIIFALSLSIVSGNTSKREYDFLLVGDVYKFIVTIWVAIIFFASIPFVVSKNLSMNFIDAIFESTSSLTTTGLSVINQSKEIQSASIIMCHSLFSWFGGLGMILLTIISIVLIKNTNESDNSLIRFERKEIGYDLEGCTIKRFVKRFIFLYISSTLLLFIFLLFSDIDIFEALCLSMSTVSTGGYSPIDSSIMINMSNYFYLVLTFFMLLLSTPLGMVVISKKKMMNFFTNVNVQVFFILVIVTSLFIYYRFNIKRDISLLKTFFLTVSLITTTGFDTLRENEVSFVNNISILLTMIGGCIGSTTAGIKIDRIVDVFNSVGYYLKSTIYPRTVFNKQSIYGKQWNNSIHFAILYIMTICFAVLVFALLTGDGNLAMNLALGSITNSGILYEKSFEMLRSSCLIKSFFSIFMLVGRVEIIAILTFFIKR